MVRRLGSHQSIRWRTIASAHCCHCQRVFASWSQSRSWTADTSLSGRWRLLIPGRFLNQPGFLLFLLLVFASSLKCHQLIVLLIPSFARPGIGRESRCNKAELVIGKKARFWFILHRAAVFAAFTIPVCFHSSYLQCVFIYLWKEQCAVKIYQYLDECWSLVTSLTFKDYHKTTNQKIMQNKRNNKQVYSAGYEFFFIRGRVLLRCHVALRQGLRQTIRLLPLLTLRETPDVKVKDQLLEVSWTDRRLGGRLDWHGFDVASPSYQ